MLVCLLKLWESIRENQSQDLKCSFSSLLRSRLTFRMPTPAVASTSSAHNLPGLGQWAFSYFSCYQKTPHCWFAYLGNVSTFRPLRGLRDRLPLEYDVSKAGKKQAFGIQLQLSWQEIRREWWLRKGRWRESDSGDNLRMGLGISAERKKWDMTLL